MAEVAESPSPNVTTNENKQQSQNLKQTASGEETEELEQGQTVLFVENQMRLKTMQLQVQNERDGLSREFFAERSMRMSLEVELNEVKERLLRTRDQIDQQKREYNEVSLRLCAVTAERDELEAKVCEVWHKMASLEESARAKDASEKALRDSLDSERKGLEAQEVLMSAMVTQLAMLEKQVAVEAGAEERQRRLHEEELRGVKEEARRLACMVESMIDGQAVVAGEGGRQDKLVPMLSNEGNGRATLAVAETAPDNGLNMSDTDEPGLPLDGHPLGPIYQAVRHLRHQVQRERSERYALQNDCRVLEAHIMALKDQLRQVGDECDNAREQLFKSEAHRSQTSSTLEDLRQAHKNEVLQAIEARRKVAFLLHCVDDWCVIEQHISDLLQNMQWLRSTLEESQRANDAYVVQKEEEVYRMIDAHQHELDAQRGQMEQIRHEYERFKRAVTTSEIIVSGGSDAVHRVNTSGTGSLGIESTAALVARVEGQREHEVMKAKYSELLRFVEDELEPLVSEQANALQEEKKRGDELRRANDALQLELKLLRDNGNRGNGQLSLFEALVLTLRTLSGSMKDAQEMAQQRRALMHYILAYEGMFGSLNTCVKMLGLRPLLRFRRAVIVVLATRRIVALKGNMYCQRYSYCCHHRREGATVARREAVNQRGDGRIRLPSETCCIVRGGLIQLPLPVEEVGEEGNVLRVTERDLQLPVMTFGMDCGAVDRVAVQGHTLRHFMETLLAFVTVPSSMQQMCRAREPLWRRLENGLHALQRSSSLDSRCTPNSHRRLMHLPPRPPVASASEALSPGVGSTFFTVVVDADAKERQRSTRYDRDSCIPLREPSSRVLSYSPWCTEDPTARNNSSAYPVPQLGADNLPDAKILEEALQQSLFRDVQNQSGSHVNQLESGFASEVLSVIQALDQRVAGALERHAKVSD